MNTSTLLQRTFNESDADSTTSVPCQTGNEFSGNLPLRISAIFVILLGSLAGILFPLLARPSSPSSSSTTRSKCVPSGLFFIAKFFGSGVIVATAFIHLLAPASESLRNPCLTGLVTEYPWVEGIVLMTVFATFFVEILVDLFAGHVYTSVREGDGDDGADDDDDDDDDDEGKNGYANAGEDREEESLLRSPSLSETETLEEAGFDSACASALLSTSQTSKNSTNQSGSSPSYRKHHQTWKSQLTSLLILESGVILHSVFIGLSLAVTGGAEFKTLYAVLVFHQTFEGLGLGIRLADIPWPDSKKGTIPYILGFTYGLSTPLAIAVGLLIRGSYSPGSQTMLIVSGVFDSISAGILIYTGLVELMAREFLFHREQGEGKSAQKKREVRTVLAAFFWLSAGAAAMAVLGKWA